jgi:auxin efflux carrier family protein
VGVSFVSIFIVSYHLIFWVLGAAHSLSWDYLPGIPQGDEAERRCSWKEKPFGSLVARYLLREPATSGPKRALAPVISSPDLGTKEKSPEELCPVPEQPFLGDAVETDPEVQLVRRMSRISALSTRARLVPEVTPPTAAAPLPLDAASVTAASIPFIPARTPLPRVLLRSLRPLTAIVTPVTVAIAISLPIALIQPLKALFVDVSSVGGPNWKGPDGKPPLAFIIDTGLLIPRPLRTSTSCSPPMYPRSELCW